MATSSSMPFLSQQAVASCFSILTGSVGKLQCKLTTAARESSHGWAGEDIGWTLSCASHLTSLWAKRQVFRN